MSAFSDAADFIMPWGKHQGLTIDKIGETDEGLKYLDWLRGEGVKDPRVKAALDVYLTDKAIAAELVKIARGGGR